MDWSDLWLSILGFDEIFHCISGYSKFQAASNHHGIYHQFTRSSYDVSSAGNVRILINILPSDCLLRVTCEYSSGLILLKKLIKTLNCMSIQKKIGCHSSMPYLRNRSPISKSKFSSSGRTGFGQVPLCQSFWQCSWPSNWNGWSQLEHSISEHRIIQIVTGQIVHRQL